MKKIIIIALLLCFSYAGSAFGQEFSTAKISALSGLAEVSKPDGTKDQTWSPAKLDQILNQGDEVRTRNGRVELTFEDGSKLNLKENTSLSLVKMQDKNQKGNTLVKLWIGQIRAKFSVQKEDSTFQVQTKNIIAAVKGTDFIVDADLNGGFLKVIQGIVSLIDAITNKELFVKAGEKASYAAAFQGKPEEMDKEEKDKLEEEWNGKKEEKAEEPKKAPETATEPPREERKAPGPGGDSGFGGSFGAVSIDGHVYYMISLFYELTFGKLGVGLDVRLLWDDNGIKEDEWQNWQRSLQSMFKYVRYGLKGEPLYLKLGVLDNSTIGHGFLVRRYSNVGVDVYNRVFGAEMDVKLGAFGIEGLCNDVTWGRLYGGRVYFDILPNFLQAGVTGVYDYNPAKDKYNLIAGNKFYLPEQGPVVAYGADLGLSLIKTGLLSVLVYADYGIFRNGGEGFAAPGVMGKVAIFDYQFEYRSMQSNFVAGLFDYAYEDNRPKAAVLPAAGGPRIKGVFGQLGANPVPWLNLVAAYEQYEGQKPYVRGEACYKGNFIPKISEVAIGYEQKDIDILTLKSPNTVAYARVGMEMAPGVIFLFTMRQTYDLQLDAYKRSTIMAVQMRF